MIGDRTFEFSTNQAITTASARSTREHDLGPVMRDIGAGTPLFMVYLVTEAFTIGADAPQLIFHNVLDVLAAQTGVGTATFVGSSVVHFASHPVTTLNDLFLGQQIVVPINPLSEAQRRFAATLTLPFRYLAAQYELAGGEFATGRITSFMTTRPPSPMKLTKFTDGIAANR